MSALDRAGYHATGPRRAMAELVRDRNGHFSALDLLEEAKRRRLRVGRATVFRALELFEELGLVERIHLPTGEHAYVVCEIAHHHHVICDRCGRSREVGDLGMETIADLVSARTGYSVDAHRVELYGLCPECRQATDTRGDQTQPA